MTRGRWIALAAAMCIVASIVFTLQGWKLAAFAAIAAGIILTGVADDVDRRDALKGI